MSNGNSSTGLIDHALRCLVPDVFYHPVWAHFVITEAALPFEQSQSLLRAVDELLTAGHLEDACRVLFICVSQGLRAGDAVAAAGNIQRILSLVEQHDLPHVAVCAAWGAAAVSVRSSRYQQAAEYLAQLQLLLGQQREWVVSDLVDIIRQILLGQSDAATIDQPLASDAVLSAVFEQLLRWGTPAAVSRISRNNTAAAHESNQADSAAPPASSSGLRWHSIWQAIKRIAKGELRLKWVDTIASAPTARPDDRSILDLTSTAIVTAPMPAQTPHPFDDSSTLDQQSETDGPAALDQPESVPVSPAQLAITAHLLGTFSFSVNDAMVQSWPTGKGRAIFKYLLAHHEQPISRDVLMDAFWPQAGPEAARNSLNVALHGLRQALKTVSDRPIVLFEEGAYCINPEFQVWVDVDEFDRHVQAGRRLAVKDQLTRAVAEYEAAIELYQGDFLSGDPYEEWPVLTRERLRVAYLETLDHLGQIYFDRKQYAACITACQQMLTRDNCREDAHCRLMQCYCRQGQHHLALRQYQICVEALRSELQVDPAPTTTQLFERIRRRERV